MIKIDFDADKKKSVNYVAFCNDHSGLSLESSKAIPKDITIFFETWWESLLYSPHTMIDDSSHCVSIRLKYVYQL